MIFLFDVLAALEPSQRAERLRELTALFTVRLQQNPDFHGEIEKIIAELRTAGHDVWNWDWDDTFEIWGPDHGKPILTGLILDFRATGEVEILWCDRSDPRDVRQIFGEGFR